MIEFDQSTRSHGQVVRDEDLGVGDEGEIKEIFSLIEMNSGSDIQGVEDGKKDIKNTYFSFYSALS